MLPDLESSTFSAQVVAEHTQMFMPSMPHWIEAVVDFLKKKAVLIGVCQESRAGKLEVALHEALSNSIIHGNLEISSQLKEQGDNTFAEALAGRVTDPEYSERKVEILVEYDGQDCTWIFTDQGKGFDVQRVLSGHEDMESASNFSSGRGILIMSSFVDEVRYELGGRRVILTLNRLSGKEKRRDMRVEHHQPLKVAPILPDGTVDWQAAYEAVSLNFSEKGLGLLQEGLAQSNRILIGIPTRNQTIYIPAEVRHFKTLDGKIGELGCRLLTKMEFPFAEVDKANKKENQQTGTENRRPEDQQAAVQEAIQNLLEKPLVQSGSKGDLRAHPRLAFNGKVEIITGEERRPLVGYTRDLSKGGIGFITVQTLAAASQVTCLLFPAGGGKPVRLRSQVVRCVKVIEGFYDVGARFLHLEGENREE